MKKLVAKDIMNTNVLSVGMDWSLEQLADYLVENSISGVPVTSDEGKLLGVVSMTDIVRYRSMPLTEDQPDDTHEYYIYSPERRYSPEEVENSRIEAESLVTVRDIMTFITFNVDEDTTIQQVADAMLRGNIHRVLVTRDDVLVGIITTMDMLKAIKDL
jgi:CBS domain-containing protein